MTKDLYLECIKNTQNSTVRNEAVEAGKRQTLTVEDMQMVSGREGWPTPPVTGETQTNIAEMSLYTHQNGGNRQ